MRELVVDLNSQPVRNIMRNPRFVGVVKDVLSNGSVTGPEFRAVPYSGGSFRVVDAVGVPGMPAGTRAVEFEAVDTGSSRGVYFAASGYATAAAGDIAGVPRVTAGQTWTVSAWVKASVSITPFFGTRIHNVPNMTAAVLAENSPVKETLPAGVWVRLTHSVSFPEGSPGIDGFMGAQIRFPTTIAVGTTVQITGLRITADKGGTDYADGDSYNWRWTGAANASESVGYQIPASFIRNAHPNPSLESSSGSSFWVNNVANATATFVRVVGDNPRSGTACGLVTRDAGEPGTRVCSVYIHTGGTIAWRVTPGETVSASAHFRPELAGRFARMRFVFRDAAGVTITNSVVSDLPLNAGVYTRHSHSQIVPAGAFGAIAILEVYVSNASNASVGERVWLDDCMLVNGPDPGIYSDGNTPGWRWTGTPGYSESVGYPYRLEDIAGIPLAGLTAPGASAEFSLGATQGRTLYLVNNHSGSTGLARRQLASIFADSDSTIAAGGAVILRNGPQAFYEARIQQNGSANLATDSIDRLIGRHVVCVTVPDNITSVGVVVDAGPSTPSVLSAGGTGLNTTGVLYMAAANSEDTPIAAYVFAGSHDADTRAKVTAWLARKYGAPIPTGY